MDVVIHKRIGSIEMLIPHWQQLNNEFRDITVFQDIGWMKCWLIYNQEKKEIIPYIVEVKFENKTIGIIPLYISQKEFANYQFRILKPIGVDRSDYLIPILSKEFSSERILNKAISAIFKDNKNWDYIDWNGIPENSLFDNVLKNLFKKNRLMKRETSDVCPFLPLNEDFDKLKLKFDKQLLGQTLSKEKKLKRKGELVFGVVKELHEIEPTMESFFELHCRRWEGTSTPSVFTSEEEKKYILQTAKHLFNANLLHLSYLSFNDKVISIHFGMSDGIKLYFYMPAYDIHFIKYSPGSILIYHLIRFNNEEGYKEFDFMRGGEKYKWLWGAEERFIVKYTFFNNRGRSLLYKFIRKTYYNQHFHDRNLAVKVVIKTFIRLTTVALRVFNKLELGRS